MIDAADRSWKQLVSDIRPFLAQSHLFSDKNKRLVSREDIGLGRSCDFIEEQDEDVFCGRLIQEITDLQRPSVVKNLLDKLTSVFTEGNRNRKLLEILARFDRYISSYADNEPRHSSVVVIPVLHKSGASIELAEGLSREIGQHLERFSNLTVTSAESAQRYRQFTDPISFGSLVGTNNVVTVRVTTAPLGTFALDLQIWDCRTGRPIWTKSLHAGNDTLSASLYRISGEIGTALKGTKPQGTSLNIPDVVYCMYLRAVGLSANNTRSDTRAALAILEEVSQEAPAFADGYGLRAYLLWRQYFEGWADSANQLDRAMEVANRGIQLDRNSRPVQFARVRISWDLGRHADAVHEALDAYKQNRTCLQAKLILARALNNAGLAQIALPLTQDVRQHDLTNATAWKLLIWNYLMAGQYARAAKHGEFYLTSHRGDANTAWAVCMSYLHLGQAKRACEVADTGTSCDSSCYVLRLLGGYAKNIAGDAPSGIKMWSEGKHVLERYVHENPTNLRARVWLSEFQALSKDSSSAVASVDQVLNLQPENGYLLYRAAHTYCVLGHIQEAISMLQRAADHGFLSGQIMMREELTGLAAIANDPGYIGVKEKIMRNMYDLANVANDALDGPI
jgi:tetratricopeptide (TPR) repeat protein